MLSLRDFVQNEDGLPGNREDVLALVTALSNAAVSIRRKVIRAGLDNLLGSAGETNIQGEIQQKLDVIANEIVISELGNSKVVSAAASEENEEVIKLDDSAAYVVAFDPLDGSSNLDVNVPIGTILSVYKKSDPSVAASESDFLRLGSEQILAAYIIYGTSTMLVLTMGNGLNGFTLDPESEKFYLSHPQMKTKPSGKIYSLNEGNSQSFPEGLMDYLEYCKSPENENGAAYSSRYIGSMVADIHRNLLKGGIFMYPASSKAMLGKLRILYECHPMAFIVEQAGGKAHSGNQRILDIRTEKLHQRTPVFIGSADMVDRLLLMMEKIKTA